ncbi:MAG: hypothetical protein LBO74_13015 [Candidatus Symbiothrix sp.]|jgi:hypothetical protein|nr:hypothetical protein [Candidatus Symbiothrix sp.]
MLKQLFILLFRLIAESIPTWKILSEKQEKDNEDFYKSYLFPIIGIIALLSFVGALISVEPFGLQVALKVVIKQVMIYGGSFYLTSFVLSEYLFPRFDLEKNKGVSERFTGYSSSLIYAVAMIQSLFPDLFFLQILAFYTFYIIWTGAAQFLNIKEDFLIKFTTFAGVLIMVVPFLINYLIDLWMPGMKI